MRLGYDMEGGEDDVFIGYSWNKVFLRNCLFYIFDFWEFCFNIESFNLEKIFWCL